MVFRLVNQQVEESAPIIVETNPGPINTRKPVWIFDICHRQIQVWKQISIRCNRIEHCAPKMHRYPPSTIYRFLDTGPSRPPTTPSPSPFSCLCSQMRFWMSLFSLGSSDEVGSLLRRSSSHHVQYLFWYRFLVDSVPSSRNVVRCCFE